MPYAQIEIRPRMHGFHRAILNGMVRASEPAPPRPPGKLVEYPSRAAHARAHRLRSEIRRRDRRRARTGRQPIQGTTSPRPRMLEVTNALAPPGPALARAARQFTEQVLPAIASTQHRINEMVYAAAVASVPLRFETVGAVDPDGASFASGGVVHGRRDPDDSVPVRISPGEAWVTPAMARRAGPGLLQFLNAPAPPYQPPDPEITHHDRWLGEGALERDETSSVHSTDSSGRGAVWSDLMTRIDDLLEEES